MRLLVSTLTASLLCLSLITEAQISNITGVGNQVLKINRYQDIQGSPYMYSEWQSGTIKDNTGQVFTNVSIKYNAYEDAVEVNQNGEVMILNKMAYPEFTITRIEPVTNKVVPQQFARITDVKLPFDGYFEILTTTGSMRVVKKYKTNFLEENVANYGTAAVIKRFQLKETVFLIDGENVEEVKLNSKSVLKVLGDKKTVAENYMKESRLKVKDESDLVQLVDYLNSL